MKMLPYTEKAIFVRMDPDPEPNGDGFIIEAVNYDGTPIKGGKLFHVG